MGSGEIMLSVDADMPPCDWHIQDDYISNYTFTLPFETNWDRRAAYIWYRRYGSICYLVALFYVIGIKIGQKLMSYRDRGFQLRLPLTLFNFVLALFSIMGLLRMSPELIRVFYRHGFEHSVCVASWTQDHVALSWIQLFIWSKFVELIDTGFLILRKRPVTFLHWYHHASVLVFTWHGMYTLTAAGRWFSVMNYAVHSVMYTYFAWRSMGFQCPRWIAMCITTLQLSQMVAGCILGYTIYAIKSRGGQCHHTWQNLYMAIAIYSTYLYLFAKYFYHAYVEKATSRKPLASICSQQYDEQPQAEKSEGEQVKNVDDNGGCRFVFVANQNDYDYYAKKFDDDVATKSAKRFETNAAVIKDDLEKKRD